MTAPSLPPAGSLSSTSPRGEEILIRSARLAAVMARRWRRGERPLAEEFLARHPELWDLPEAALDLIYEEICLRLEQGEMGASQEVLERFPQWRKQLEILLECHRLLDPERRALRFPEAGEALGEFCLVSELGRGANGRVFLATQPALADRPVVLKLTPCHGQEHLALARLQHTHIVPLYSAQDVPPRGLRLLCMPYFGGTTLARFLEAVGTIPPARRSGRHLLEVIDAAADPVAVPARGAARACLARSSYTQAVCWLGAQLAEALHYAHERGLVHLDLKPSNILLAADGQPMLLDFHLAREPVRPDGPPPDWLGGTPAYLSPEQKAALAALQEGRPVPAAVDGRSDIYSLGLVLYEMLAGVLPPTDTPPARALRRIPTVSPGLADLVGKCLDPDPGRRYPTAAELAGDLRRHLAALPLLGVRNRSLAERWRKWRHRQPHAFTLVKMFLVALSAVALAAGIALVHSGQKGEWDRQERRRHEAAERARLASELQRLLARMRLLYAADPGAAGDTVPLESACRALWQKRHLLREVLESEGASARIDLLDLAILYPSLRLRRAGPTEATAAREEARRVLDEAETLLGPSGVLDHQRQLLAGTPGPKTPARGAPPHQIHSLPARDAWEHYALGRALLNAGDLRRADESFRRAVALDPQGLWPNFYQAVCAYRLGRHEDAVVAFTVCVARAAPRELPGCLYNRGLAYAAWGRLERARADYDRALSLDPTMVAAALNRGMLHHRAGRHAEALRDLQLALKLGAPPATVYYDRAIVHLARHERARARACLVRVLALEPGHKAAHDLLRTLP